MSDKAKKPRGYDQWHAALLKRCYRMVRLAELAAPESVLQGESELILRAARELAKAAAKRKPS